MATNTWTGSVSTDWNTPGNWSQSAIPTSADDVVIGTTATLPTLSASTTVNTITINGSDTLSLAGTATTLTATNGITLSSTGGISGAGAVVADVTASGAGHITASGGTLEVTGTITDSDNTLTLSIAGAADSLLLDAASAAHTVTFGSSGTLEINIGAALTVGTAMAIDAGTLQLDGSGSTFTDASGVTTSTGTIRGAGTVAASVTATGAAHITATGGALVINGSITDSSNALTLTIAGATDTLLIGGSVNTTHAVIFGSSGTLELGHAADLTVGTTMAIGTGTVQFNGGTIHVASGMTITTGTIIGNGTLGGSVTATGAAQITAAGGALEFSDAVIDNGDALMLSVSGSGLRFDAASTAHEVVFAGGSASGTLSLFDTLTVGTAMAIGTGAVNLAVPGSALTDASGATMSGGLIKGQGTVNADLSGSSGVIQAVGGTLHLTGTVESLTLTIADVAGSVLSIENTATASPVMIDTSNKTLAIGSSGNLTINGGAESITNGTIKLTPGGQLSDSAGFMIGGGALLFGSGVVTGAISGSGIVEASGGTLELVNAIPASDGTAFNIANSLLARLLLDAAPGSGNTFTFAGAHGQLALADDTGLDDTISGLNVGTGGAKTNFVDIEGHTVTISSVTGQGTTSGTITLSDGAALNLSNLSSAGWFANAVGDGSSGTDIFVSDTACFCRGTLILTACGEAAVENLAIGDKVVTLSGVLRGIKWIGRRAYDGRFVAANRAVLPIRVAAGALAPGLPARDLWLSSEHALYIDGALVPAGLLVNGATIRQAASVDRLEYFHIELERHDVILAEGAPAETFVDCDSRGIFHNAGEFAELYPDDSPIPWDFCAPRAEEGSAVLAAIRAALSERAQALGYGPRSGSIDRPNSRWDCGVELAG